MPDFEKPSLSGSRAISSLEIALIKLQAERELTGELWADDFGELNPETEFDLDFSPLTLDEIRESCREEKIKSIISRHPCLADLPKGVQVPSEIVLPCVCDRTTTCLFCEEDNCFFSTQVEQYLARSVILFCGWNEAVDEWHKRTKTKMKRLALILFSFAAAQVALLLMVVRG